ncbi:iron transporter FeoB [Phenylobacterium sp. Root77]|uniref:ferrous iron transporter B n=1 Tax=unclassified Phenylobacterium TaxID=2640670 RepID=UPI0006F5FD6E|nr:MULTISPECIES: ferrous iron transporter B [unclassified Phenylobacterium]KQW72999.1 iron transporter FeoB [Phenylobacterium sp. Root1277]KQW92218.1 iron transporter FeoB [Phenylobacterium sp. Root1290]KRC40449.1 iron transporter FeoB [Phenylobacterium sp. Root77]
MNQTLSPARVALVGNPNSGKTALFNALTGARQKVANYAGVTVERKEGVVTSPAGRQLMVLDLPGTYSLRARSPDEAVTRDAVLGRLAGEVPPEIVICVADATNLRLVLRLAMELKQVGRPMVLALNMYDIAQRQGLRIDLEGLSREIGAPIVTTVATRKRGIEDLLAQVDALVEAGHLAGENVWREPNAAEIRQAHAEAQRIVRTYVRPPEHPDTWTGRIDSVLLHPVAGLAILFGLLFLMFQAVFTWAGPAMDAIEALFGWLGAAVAQYIPNELLQSLVADGLIAGVGSVLVFLPQILILFFFIILLEDLGYMARAAFLMDKIMGGAGLHGRAFIPLLSSFACAIPGIMSTRVIDSKPDRITTILVAPLMTCSARIPVYTLIIGAFIPNTQVWGLFSLQGLVMFGLYATGIVSALVVSFITRRIFWRSTVEPFLMELPTYKLPEPKSVLRNLLVRAQIFINRAGRIILPMMILIWVLSTFPYPPEGAAGPAIDYSFAGIIGNFIQPLLAPIGFNWQMSIALIPGMAAREVAVATLGTVYAVGDAENNIGALATTLSQHWSVATGLSFLTWYIFAPQCAPTLGVVKRETNSWVWPTVMFVYMVALAYIASFIVYRTAVALGGG